MKFVNLRGIHFWKMTVGWKRRNPIKFKNNFDHKTYFWLCHTRDIFGIVSIFLALCRYFWLCVTRVTRARSPLFYVTEYISAIFATDEDRTNSYSFLALHFTAMLFDSSALHCTALGLSLHCSLHRTAIALHFTGAFTALHCTGAFTALHCTGAFTALHCTGAFTALH